MLVSYLLQSVVHVVDEYVLEVIIIGKNKFQMFRKITY